MDVTYRQCSPDDVRALRDISRKTFQETFADQNSAADLQAYLDKAFDTDKLRGELSDENSRFYFLYADGELAGYLKLNQAPAQTDINDEDTLEIERIYVAQAYQGRGLGRYLMNLAVRTAQAAKKSCIWLGVWEKNEKAIAFYKKHGFTRVGVHPFILGGDAQTDYIMRKTL